MRSDKVGASTRPTISLDDIWRLSIEGRKKDYPVTVPAPWGSQSPELRGYTGQATYRRSVRVPASWKRNRVFVCFGAVDYFCEVYVNGVKVGEHEGGYTPFEFDITDQIEFGVPSSMEVRVTDPGPDKPAGGFRFEEIPHGKQSWYGNCSGIWQSVRLESRAKSHIGRLIVDPDIDSSTAKVTAVLAGTAKCDIRFSITAPKGAPSPASATVNLAKGAGQGQWMAKIPSQKLWSTEDPNVYEVRAELVVDGEVVDTLASTFGMRKIEARDGKILLNNKPVFIAAALDQDFYPETHYTIPSRKYVEDQFKKAKQMGLNMLRCHIKVPDPVYMDCADRLGLLVWHEIPNWMELTDNSRRRAKETFQAMMERDHNHPSLVVVSIINEGWGINVLEHEDHRVWLGEMYDFAKALEPDRLIVDNSPCGRNFHVKSDIDDFHIYYQIPDLAPGFAEWIKTLAGRPSFTFTSGPEGRRRGDEPIMLSEFGNWGLPKLGPLTDCEGGKPWWYDTGRRANTFPVGAEERFLNHRLDRVFGSFDGLAEEFQWQEWRALKYQIEEMRKYASIVGYVVTEFTDLHWEPNGLLDFCRNPKVFSHLMPTLQEQDIVFGRMAKQNYAADEKASVDVWVSHFSDKDLSKAVVRWRVPGTDLAGELACKVGKAPFAKAVAKVQFAMPSVRKPQRMKIEMDLLDPSGVRVRSSYYDFTVFPGVSPQMPKGVLVSSKLNRKLIKQIRGGSTAVICLERPEDLEIKARGLEIKDRVEDGCWCNCLTWFKPSSAFAGTPVPRAMDLSFESIIPSSAIKQIKPEFWADDVLGGIFVGWVDSQVAVMAQFKCGKGRAIVTTLPLTNAADSDPMAKWLLASLAKYVASNACSPELEIGNK